MSRQWRSDDGKFLKGFVPKNKGNRTPCFCKHCGCEFYPLDQVKRVYCSKDCYKQGRCHPNKGKAPKYTCLTCGMTFQPKSHGSREKGYKFCSVVCKGKCFSGENSPNWKGGITSENHRIRNSYEYKEWRMAVLQRDRFACVNCGYRSRGKKSRDVVVDHKKPFSLFPELRFSVDNGRTLCRNCDAVLGWNYHRNGGKYE